MGRELYEVFGPCDWLKGCCKKNATNIPLNTWTYPLLFLATRKVNFKLKLNKIPSVFSNECKK